ncbi:hypothetical protein CAEBREN_16126 [Caenorhabditis brenneri]|uniref:Uncharacterized protein n=1 Tax=Caenorhabditis brenneri TaxID=135651 RepID=G0MLB6_CAEBE|nr:hypothetical protein CAEBREN_16126 [Caenorhabditis brenneri]
MNEESTQIKTMLYVIEDKILLKSTIFLPMHLPWTSRFLSRLARSFLLQILNNCSPCFPKCLLLPTLSY